MLLRALYTLTVVISGGFASIPACGVERATVAAGITILDTRNTAGCSTNRALGYAVGRQFKSEIISRLSKLGPDLKLALEFTQKSQGRKALSELANATSKAYPQYWEEMLGISEGSEVPKELIMFLNFRQELIVLAQNGQGKDGANDCSDAMLSYKENALLGHNEDNSADSVNTTYFVQAKLNGRSWTAYTYAGELSSAAWGFNDAGISFTLNAVYAKEVETQGVGRNFVSRSILDAENFNEAIRRITVPHQATGHNINLIGLDGRQIATIETGPGSISSVKLVHNESYFHANAYKRLRIPQVPGPSSEHREKRAAELKAPRSKRDVLNILGDTKDHKYPIWRSGSDGEFTLCTALFDLQSETVEIFFSNPKEEQPASAQISMSLRNHTSMLLPHTAV